MSKLIIKKENDHEVGFINMEFNVGKISDDRKIEGNAVSLGMGTENTSKYMKQLVFQHGKGENYDAFEEALEQYFMLRLSHMIGVEQSPLKRDREGKIVGLNKEVEIVEGE